MPEGSHSETIASSPVNHQDLLVFPEEPTPRFGTSKLSFKLYPSGLQLYSHQVVTKSGIHPATPYEVEMWKMIKEMESEIERLEGSR